MARSNKPSFKLNSVAVLRTNEGSSEDSIITSERVTAFAAVTTLGVVTYLALKPTPKAVTEG